LLGTDTFQAGLNRKGIIEGNTQVKLPTIWTNGKAEAGRAGEEKGRRKKIREENQRKERVRRK
jgi:hypothetical protein